MRVGSFQTASLHLLLPAMDALRQTHPGVEVRLVESETEPALEALPSHALDLVLADEWAGHAAGAPCRGSTARTCSPSRCCSRSRPATRRPRGGPVRLKELAGETWATGYAGGGMAALVQRVCATHGGFEPRRAPPDERAVDAARASSPAATP